MSSSSNDGGGSPRQNGLYLNSDDSATTLNEISEHHNNGPETKSSQQERQLTVRCTALEAYSAKECLLRILTTWAVFLHRGTLNEEQPTWSWRCNDSEREQKSTAALEQTVSAYIPDSKTRIDEVQNRLRQSQHMTALSRGDLANGVILEAISSSDSSKAQLLSICCRIAEETVSVTVVGTSGEMSSAMASMHTRTFLQLFEGATAQGAQSVQDLLKPTEHELSQIWSWGRDMPPLISRGMHEYFTENAKTHPSKPAVVSWDGELTYGQLEDLSTNLAVYLSQHGVKLGTAVPFCFEKSAWTVVAVLAVMKAGGTFVLTDPTQPETRLKTIVEEVGARIILTSIKHAELGNRLSSSAEVMAVGLEFLRNLPPQTTSSLKLVPGSATMYIIFTSGSTGKPKGVMLSHENYTSGAVPRADAVGYRNHTRVLDFASYAFDVSIDCMLCTLATGGCICVPSNEQRMNDLSGAIRDMQVNMVHTTPSVARVLDADIIPSLEVLGVGGEALSARDAENWNQQTHVINAYGPSECTVGCAINNDIAPGRSYVSLGRGVGGILWIVNPDNHDELAPIGAVGELLVEGPIVGLGYINEPEKTAAVYIEDPLWLTDGDADSRGRHARLYKTGDLVKYDPDASGCVVFVGRKDQQVKIRGQRVELGEVEHHLRSKLPPKTAVAAEVIKPGGSGEPVLVAFVSEHGDGEAIQERGSVSFSPSLRDTLLDMEKALAVEAPVYMIPSAYIPLREMPIMVSGKTDRKKLRNVGSSMSRKDLNKLRLSSDKGRRPESETQKQLARLWCRLIGEQEINLDDSFFALGGDSIKAMKLVTLAREQGLSISVATIFGSPTLEAMAAKSTTTDVSTAVQLVQPYSLLSESLTPEQARSEAAKLCEVAEKLIEDVLPCTPLQEILMAFSAKVTEAYVAQRVLKLTDQTAADNLRLALKKTIAGSPILRTRIVHLPGQGLVQVVLNEDTEIREARDLDAYVKLDQDTPTGLGDALARFAIVVDERSDSHYFVLTMHHALYDGWSMPLVVDRLNRAHNGLGTTRTAGFSAYIKYLQTMDRSSSEAFWREQLDGASARQFPVRAQPGYQPQPDSLLEKYVKLDGAEAGTSTTVANTIRAAWALVSSELAGTDDVIFGETLTGRNAPIPGVEEIEGPLITTVPVRVRIDKATRAVDLLGQVHQHAVDRIPHEHFGLQNIRKTSSDGRRVYSNMFSGLVLHPYVEQADSGSSDAPADGLVPVNDAEAAREALKFNSYAVMLVCTLDPAGIFIMASFDSSIVPQEEMQQALGRLEELVQQLSQSNNKLLSEISASSGQNASPTPLEETPEREGDAQATTPSTGLISDERVGGLREVWSRLLEIDASDIAIHDSFFELGGDSIAAMKLVSEMKQKGYKLSVADMFSHRRLNEMASALQATTHSEQRKAPMQPFKTIGVKDGQSFVKQNIKPELRDESWDVENVLSVRPLQEVAVNGTIAMPRYSARYELFIFDSSVDKQKLFDSCQQLVDRNEILRTVFVRAQGRCLAAVLKNMRAPLFKYNVDGDVENFAHCLCELDVQTSMPLGTPFVKFLFVQGPVKSCLLFRISHAQYDELCLPIMLRQLSQLYEGKPVEEGRPFSGFVEHVVEENIPQGVHYWRKLLDGSQLTRIVPDVPLASKVSVAVQKTVNISHRTKRFTLATYPTAAWALCLARRLGIDDVTFGEVASGRNTLDGADRIVGPCWQYIPCRIRFAAGWTAADLLNAVQQQHITSAQFEGIGLPEVVEQCTDWPKSTDWFDSVVHQDVAHVEELSFASGSSRMETVYPHLEPLREWKVQAFNQGDKMTLEIVTFESWKGFAESLLVDLVAAFEQLLKCSQDQALLHR